MHRPSVRAGRAAVAGAALALLLTACGSGGGSDDEGPSKATVACRSDWSDLSKQVKGRDSKTNPSALAPRWNSVVATIDYYRSSAKSSGCEKALTQQKAAISALDTFGTTLAPYDMELRLVEVRDDAEAYATGPTPSASPAPVAECQRSSQGREEEAEQAEEAEATAAATDPHGRRSRPEDAHRAGTRGHAAAGPGLAAGTGRRAQRRRGRREDAAGPGFLSTESAAYRACQAALAQITLGLAAAEK